MEPDLERSTELYKAGREKMEVGDYRSAIALLNESNTAFPHFKTLELLGECQLDQDRPLEAIIPLAAAIGLGSSEFKAMYLLAKAFLALGRSRDAAKFLDLALAIN